MNIGLALSWECWRRGYWVFLLTGLGATTFPSLVYGSFRLITFSGSATATTALLNVKTEEGCLMHCLLRGCRQLDGDNGCLEPGISYPLPDTSCFDSQPGWLEDGARIPGCGTNVWSYGRQFEPVVSAELAAAGPCSVRWNVVNRRIEYSLVLGWLSTVSNPVRSPADRWAVLLACRSVRFRYPCATDSLDIRFSRRDRDATCRVGCDLCLNRCRGFNSARRANVVAGELG